MRRLAIAVGAAAVLAAAVSGCAGGGAPATATPPKPAAATPTKPAAVVTPAGVTTPAAGNVDAGKQLIVSKGCTACHIVPGVPEAKGTIGPSLAGVASRPQIAGALPNNAENMAKWLKNPPAVKPGTAMPNLNLTDQEVANLVAFMMTLR